MRQASFVASAWFCVGEEVSYRALRFPRVTHACMKCLIHGIHGIPRPAGLLINWVFTGNPWRRSGRPTNNVGGVWAGAGSPHGGVWGKAQERTPPTNQTLDFLRLPYISNFFQLLFPLHYRIVLNRINHSFIDFLFTILKYITRSEVRN